MWLIASTVLLGDVVIAASGLGRYALNTAMALLGSTTPAVHGAPTTNVSCFDTSPHKARFVTVDADVRLEVLDWGGAGEPMVLLTGSGDNAHVYDEFAYQFTDRFHVIGITRRGFGRSSQPARGYDLDTRARDDIAVLDTLGIRQAVFVGHSIAGTELSALAKAYPNRISKLVYLDALDIGSGGWAKLAQPPRAPELSATDLESAQRLAAAAARDDGFRKPLAAICNMVRTDAPGRVLGPISAPDLSGKLLAGLQPADYDAIRAPALGIFNHFSGQFRVPYYWALTPAEQHEFDRSIGALSRWNESAIQRFRSEVKDSRVVELSNTNHYVYIVDEARVVREMRKFLLGNQ
jgi:non-heme chloroperoxidase